MRYNNTQISKKSDIIKSQKNLFQYIQIFQ